MPILALALASFVFAISSSFVRALLVGLLFYFAMRFHRRIAALENEISILRGKKDPSVPTSIETVDMTEKAQVANEKPSPQSAQPIISASSNLPEAAPLKLSEESFESSSADRDEEKIGSSWMATFLQGNPIARIGAVIFFFGVIFALKFAADVGLFPIEFRLILAAGVSMAFLGIGFTLRNSKRQFALILQGVGVGVLYITTFIAYKFYYFIPTPLAFPLLVAITALSGVLSVLQNAKSLAFLAIVGGFLAPLLSSEKEGSHIALFSYMALLNVAIFAICWLRAWRSLNYVGYIFTFLIGVGWAYGHYTEDLYLSIQLFLLFFTLLFTTLNVLYTVKQKEGVHGSVDSLMTFGVPLLSSILQWNLVYPYEYGIALSLAGYGAFHVLLARALVAKYGKEFKFMVESLAMIGLTLLSLAIPFIFSGTISSAIWALEAAALVWSGIRQERLRVRIFGLLLLPLALMLFLAEVERIQFYNIYLGKQEIAFLNWRFFGIIFLTVGHLLSGIVLLRDEKTVTTLEKRIASSIVIISCAIWFIGGVYEIARHLEGWLKSLNSLEVSPILLHGKTFEISAYSLFMIFSVFAFWQIFRWSYLFRFCGIRRLLTPIHCVLFIWFLATKNFNFVPHSTHLLSLIGLISWSCFFLLNYRMLYVDEKGVSKTSSRIDHALTLWLLVAVITWEVSWLASYYKLSEAWQVSAFILIPTLFAFMVYRAVFLARHWPFIRNAREYSASLGALLCWSFILSFLSDLIFNGAADPILYVPFLNPLDLAQGGTLVVVLLWMRQHDKFKRKEFASQKSLFAVIGLWLFIWATATLLRILSNYFYIRWDFVVLFKSNLVQASLSIFWTLLALTLMLIAHNRNFRRLWQIGAFLITLVVAKLFLIDLSNQETFARIAAFLGVGLLMLGIGYLAPIPPVDNQKE